LPGFGPGKPEKEFKKCLLFLLKTEV
jgi:hypothetical protein